MRWPGAWNKNLVQVGPQRCLEYRECCPVVATSHVWQVKNFSSLDALAAFQTFKSHR